MQRFKADLHIHSLLSPCGSLEMSPRNIINEALRNELAIIAITDHNSTKQAPLIRQLAEKEGLFVLLGAEVNTSEEVHCLTFFETTKQLKEFQLFLDQRISPILNNADIFGDQVVVDKDEMIIEEVKYLLVSAINASLKEVEKKVHELNGLLVPAHVDRPFYGLFSQLGFVPDNVCFDGFELSKNANIIEWKNSNKLPQNTSIVQSSDAHYPHLIGEVFSWLHLNEISFQEIKYAFKQFEGRKIEISTLHSQ